MVDTNNDTAARGSDALLPAASRVAVMTVTVIAVLAVAWLLVELSGLLMLVFASLALATVFDAMTRRICRLLGAPRGLALALSVLAFLGVFAAAFFLFGAQLAREFDTIRSALPSAFEKILAFVERLGLGEAFESGFPGPDLVVGKVQSGCRSLDPGIGILCQLLGPDQRDIAKRGSLIIVCICQKQRRPIALGVTYGDRTLIGNYVVGEPEVTDQRAW